MNQDVEHLRLLSIFHYVWAVLITLGSCVAIIPGFFGFGLIASGAVSTDGAPALVNVVFLLIAAGIILLSLTLAGVTFYAGKCLADRKHWTFCIVVAAISCLSFPIGTLLGVFTIIVLARSSVKAMFDGRTA